MIVSPTRRSFAAESATDSWSPALLTEIGGQIGWLASGMNFRFKKPVYFGDTIECRLTISELDERNRAKADAIFKNQQNEIVIEANLTGIAPGPAERRVMEAMLAEGDLTNKHH
jgi:3-hydroxybutyryl-CoA dehydratase